MISKALRLMMTTGTMWTVTLANQRQNQTLQTTVQQSYPEMVVVYCIVQCYVLFV